MSMNFNGTLHIHAEPPDYFIEQARRRPRRQRVAAVFLAGLAVVLATLGLVPSPAADTTATVTGQTASAGGRVQIEVSYPSPINGALTAVDVTLPAGWSVADYQVGATVRVHATTNDAGGNAAALPQTHAVQGALFALLPLAGAVALLRAARRNEANPPDPDRRNYRLVPGVGLGRRPAG